MARRPGPVPTYQKVIAMAETAKVPKVWGRWKWSRAHVKPNSGCDGDDGESITQR